MNNITYMLLLTFLPTVYLQAADKEQAQVKSSCAALVPTAPGPTTPYHDRYFEAFKELVARSKFRVSKEDWNRIQDLDYTKTNCAHSQRWCCGYFTDSIALNNVTPISTYSINFTDLYANNNGLKLNGELLAPLLFDAHPGHTCIAITTGVNPKTGGLYHSFTVEKYSDTNTCWWRIYQSQANLYSLAEWLCIDTPCHTDNEGATVVIKKYGSGKKLTPQELLQCINVHMTLLLKYAGSDQTTFDKNFKNMKLTAKAYNVHQNFYTDMDKVLAQQAATTAPSLAAELVKQSAQNSLCTTRSRSRDDGNSTDTGAPSSKRHKPEPTDSDSGPSLSAQPVGVSCNS